MRAWGAVLVLVLVACGPRWHPYEPTTVPTASPPDDAFSRALRVLSTEGYAISSKDRDAGVIETEWVEGSLGSDKHRTRWVVTIDEGEIAVTSQCQQNVDVPGRSWQPCGSRQPGPRTEQGMELARRIAGG